MSSTQIAGSDLVARAAAVMVAARTKDDARIVQAAGRLTETCVACHSLYLRDEFEFTPVPGSDGPPPLH